MLRPSSNTGEDPSRRRSSAEPRVRRRQLLVPTTSVSQASVPSVVPEPSGVRWAILTGVVMVTLFVFRHGDKVVRAFDLASSKSAREVKPLDPDSEEGKRAAQTSRDFEAMQRAEAKTKERPEETPLERLPRAAPGR